MIIQKEIDLSKPLTQEQIEMLERAAQMPIEPDEDCPELTDEQIAAFRKLYNLDKEDRVQSRKQNVTLRLKPDTVQKAKSIGKGYTSVLALIIEDAMNDPMIIKKISQRMKKIS